jgi:hypothetical protein
LTKIDWKLNLRSFATPYGTREGQEGEMVFNLMLANPQITSRSMLADDQDTGSAQEAIEWLVDVVSLEDITRI